MPTEAELDALQLHPLRQHGDTHRKGMSDPIFDLNDGLDELVAARGSKASLDARLDVALNEDGTLKAPAAPVPSGGIIMWSGTLATIPSGWALCDGTNETPDLRDKFIYGWSEGVDPGGTGGTSSHLHTQGNTGSGGSHSHSQGSTGWVGDHSHSLPDWTTNAQWMQGWNTSWNPHADGHRHQLGGSTGGTGGHSHSNPNTNSGGSHSHTNPNTNSSDHIPPYYKLAFIMKL